MADEKGLVIEDEKRGYKKEYRSLSLELIEPNEWNPNYMNDMEFNRLVKEMDDTGQIDPIQVVEIVKDEKYRIIGGEHRFHAGRALGWKAIDCLILSGKKWMDTDLQRFVTLRLNLIKGKLNPEKFFNLYSEMSERYGDDALRELYGFCDTDYFDKLTRNIRSSIKDGLPPAAMAEFDKASKEIKSVEGLSLLLNSIYSKYGDDLKSHNFLTFSFRGGNVFFVDANQELWKQVKDMEKRCREESLDINDVFLAEFSKKA